MEGFEEAAEIIRKYDRPEMVPPYGKLWNMHQEPPGSAASRVLLESYLAAGQFTVEEQSITTSHRQLSNPNETGC